MEVSGIKGQREVCKQCEGHNVSTFAGGFCTQCSEHMCKACFDTHQQSNFNRGYCWSNTNESGSSSEQFEPFILCDKHSNEPLKFFCLQHEQVGCGDCVVLYHKTCKIEYILDLANCYLESKEHEEFKNVVVEKCAEVIDMKTSIEKNKEQIKHVNDMFKRDVNNFKEEITSHITQLANTLLESSEDIMVADLQIMDSLEKVNEGIINETSNINDTLRSLADQPYKMFITLVDYKKKIHQLQDQLERIKENNKFEAYTFQRDDSLEYLIKDVNQLGKLQKNDQNKTAEETVNENEIAQTIEATASSKSQPLLDKQLICKNLTVDKDCISYSQMEDKGVGLFVSNEKMFVGKVFEIEILSMDKNGSIVIGVVPSDNPDKLLQASEDLSWGYHSDGKLHDEGAYGLQGEQSWKVGDRIGCAIKEKYFALLKWKVRYIHNGKVIGRFVLNPFKKYLFAVGMKSTGDKVKVILDKKM